MVSYFFRSSACMSVVAILLALQITPAFAQASTNLEASPSGTTNDFLPYREPATNLDLITEADDDAYALGPGDILRFDIFNVPELTNDRSGNRLVSDNLYNVLVDGTVNLPWIGRVPVRGLSLEEASRRVESRYSEFVLDPVVTFTLFTPRPVRVAISGEVKRPGAYSSEQAGTPDSAQPNIAELRTVVQAIQAAGGITQLADIRNIEIRRPQLDGSEQVIPIDFFALLEGSGQEQNLLLRDGDTIIVPTAVSLNPAEAEALAAANFSPNTIGIDVVGEVTTPGRVDIKPNSTLNQAILAAGGFDDPRARTGSVAFIRLNPDGTVTNRKVEVNLDNGLNEETNPALREDDIIIVARSSAARNTDFLTLIGGAASAIINPILGITTIINEISNFGDGGL